MPFLLLHEMLDLREMKEDMQYQPWRQNEEEDDIFLYRPTKTTMTNFMEKFAAAAAMQQREENEMRAYQNQKGENA